MHSRTVLALVCALGLGAVGVLGNGPAAPSEPGVVRAQLLRTATPFVPRAAPTLSLPTPFPTPGLPGGFPLVPSPTPRAAPAPPDVPTAPAAPPSPSASAPAEAAPPPPPAGLPPAPADGAPDAPGPPAPADVAPGAAGVPGAPPSPPAAAPPAPPAVWAEDVQPPAIQLRFGSALYDGVRGSFCWTPPAESGAPPTPGLCVDVLPPVFETVLAWPAGAPLEFVVGGPEPTGLTLAVYSKPTDPVVLRTELPAANTPIWEPTVAPGAYVLGVTARWPQGDVTYYFPVGILDGDAPADPAAEPGFVSGDGVIGPAAPTPTVPAPLPAPSAAPATAPPVPTSASPASTAESLTRTLVPTSAAGPPPAVPAASALPSPPNAAPPRPPSPALPNSVAAPPAITPTPPGASTPSGGAGRVLLRDEFTDPDSGFPLESREPTARRLGYLNGEYLVARLAGSGGAAFVAYPERLADFQAEIDARLVPPTDDGYVFLDFRRQENGDFYSFLVDPNAGKFLLLRHTGGDDARLIDWTDATAIQPGAASNRLGVRARGGNISLYVGGTAVGSAQDGALREGWVGFGVDSLTDDRAEGRFSHLLVTAPN